MVYRDWLCGLGEAATLYVRDLCHKRRADMTQQITVLYETAQASRRADFLAALELAAEQQMYGAEYVQAILSLPRSGAPGESAHMDLGAFLPSVPTQQEVERDLAQYEYYVANRDSVGADPLPARGGRA
jgi:hypothetical protein